METETARMPNGLDTKKMYETIEAIKARPTLARFEFRNSNRWITGGGNPVEFLLHALAGCVTTAFVPHAGARGIKVESISTEMNMDIKADCPDEELDSLPVFFKEHSPTCRRSAARCRCR